MNGAFTRGRCRVSRSQLRVSRKVLLHPVQRRPDRLVMRPHHRTVAPGMALRRQQRRQRYRLRRRKGQVESRTALVPAVPDPPQPDLRPRHMTLQQLLQRPRRHPRARLQTQRLQPRSRATRSPRGAPPASREALPRRRSTRRNTPPSCRKYSRVADDEVRLRIVATIETNHNRPGRGVQGDSLRHARRSGAGQRAACQRRIT